MPQERKTRIPVYVNAKELQFIREAAAAVGLSMSEFLRLAGLRAAGEARKE